jgi:hypothetical protein
MRRKGANIVLQRDIIRAQTVTSNQSGFIILCIAATMPYWFPHIDLWIKIMLAVMLGLLAVYTFFLHTFYHIHRIARDVLRSNEVQTDEIYIEKYINALVICDVLWLFFQVVLTGGLTSSSFTPLLFILPSLAMIYRAQVVTLTLGISTFFCLILALLEVPTVLNFTLNYLGEYRWILDFDGNTVPGAYAVSVVITTFGAVWAAYFQKSVLPSG